MTDRNPTGWNSGFGSSIATFSTSSGDINISIDALARNPGLISIDKRDLSYHEYAPKSETNIKVTDAPFSRVLEALKAQPTPSPLTPKVFAGPGAIFNGSVPSSPDSIVNVTVQGWHMLDPGVVQRTLVVEDGRYVIKTIGIGVGDYPKFTQDWAQVVWDAATSLLPDPNQKVIDDYLDSLPSRMDRFDKSREREAADKQVTAARGKGYTTKDIADAIESGAPGALSFLASGRDKRDNPYGPLAGAPQMGGTDVAGMLKATQSNPNYNPAQGQDPWKSNNPADREYRGADTPHSAAAPSNNQQFDRDHQSGDGSRSGGPSHDREHDRDHQSGTGSGIGASHDREHDRDHQSGDGSSSSTPPSDHKSEPDTKSDTKSDTSRSSGPASGGEARTGNDPTGPNGAAHGSGSGDPTGRGPTYGGPKPILLDLNGDGVSIGEVSRSNVFMDSNNDGLLHRTAWAAAGDGVLFFDVNGDGRIGETREYVFTEWDPTATSDLEALRAAFDSNGDGWLTAADARFASFKVMVTNADGSLTAKTLSQLGITEIGLKGDATHMAQPDGSVITGQSAFRRSGGSTLTRGDDARGRCGVRLASVRRNTRGAWRIAA